MTPLYEVALMLALILAVIRLGYDTTICLGLMFVEIATPILPVPKLIWDKIGTLLDIVMGFARQSMVTVLVIVVIALLRVLEVHP